MQFCKILTKVFFRNVEPIIQTANYAKESSKMHGLSYLTLKVSWLAQHKVEMVYNADSQTEQLTKAKCLATEVATFGFYFQQTDSKEYSPTLHLFRCNSSI